MIQRVEIDLKKLDFESNLEFEIDLEEETWNSKSWNDQSLER